MHMDKLLFLVMAVILMGCGGVGSAMASISYSCFPPAMPISPEGNQAPCPAYAECLFNNTPWYRPWLKTGRRGEPDKSQGWKAKYQSRTNWKACKSFKPSCIETIRKSAWGSHYDQCLAEHNAPARQSSGKGAVAK